MAKKRASISNLGADPKDGDRVMIRKGRCGPYAQHGQLIANMHKDQDMNEIKLDAAVALRGEKGKPLKGAAKKTTAKKAQAKTAKSKKTSDVDATSGEEAPKKKTTRATTKTSTARKTAGSATKKRKTAADSFPEA